jgi:hypothetical protein
MRNVLSFALVIATVSTGLAGTYSIKSGGWVTNSTLDGAFLTNTHNSIRATVDATITALPTLQNVILNPTYVGDYVWRLRFVATGTETPLNRALKLKMTGYRQSAMRYWNLHGYGGVLGGYVTQQDSSHTLIAAWSNHELSRYAPADVTAFSLVSGDLITRDYGTLQAYTSGWTRVAPGVYEGNCRFLFKGADVLSVKASPDYGNAIISAESKRSVNLTLIDPDGVPLAFVP